MAHKGTASRVRLKRKRKSYRRRPLPTQLLRLPAAQLAAMLSCYHLEQKKRKKRSTSAATGRIHSIEVRAPKHRDSLRRRRLLWRLGRRHIEAWQLDVFVLDLLDARHPAVHHFRHGDVHRAGQGPRKKHEGLEELPM